MRIGIDSTYLDVSYKSGVYYYLKNLLDALAKIDKHNSYYLYYNSLIRGKKRFLKPSSRFTRRVLRCPNILERVFGREVFYRFLEKYFAYAVRKDRLDVFFSPHLRLPALDNVRCVVTINDIAFLSLPEYRRREEAAFLKMFIKRIEEKQAEVIAISEFTKSEILKYTKINEQRIRVIPYGRDLRFRKIGSLNPDIRKKYNIPEQFILYVGSIEPRKNIQVLIKTFFYLKQEKKIPHKLVIIGGKGVMYKEVFRQIAPYWQRIKEDVIFRGQVSNNLLVYFYNLCNVFTTCSLYEGFGLPVLEALGCGCSIVCSDIPVFRKVAGDAVLFADPYAPEDFAAKIYRILSDADLSKSLQEKALRRAAFFSWEDTARKTLKVYAGRF